MVGYFFVPSPSTFGGLQGCSELVGRNGKTKGMLTDVPFSPESLQRLCDAVRWVDKGRQESARRQVFNDLIN